MHEFLAKKFESDSQLLSYVTCTATMQASETVKFGANLVHSSPPANGSVMFVVTNLTSFIPVSQHCKLVVAMEDGLSY